MRRLAGPGGSGIHTVWWDLRSDGTANAEYGREAGMTPSEWAYRQLVPVGTYTVTVRTAGEEASTTVKVRDEPADGVRQASPRK